MKRHGSVRGVEARLVSLRKPKKKETGAVGHSALMLEGAIVELDGFKRSNPQKYPTGQPFGIAVSLVVPVLTLLCTGPQHAYRLFAVPAPQPPAME